MGKGVRDLHWRVAEFDKIQVAKRRCLYLSLKGQAVFRDRVVADDLLAGEAVPKIKSVAGVNRAGREYRFHVFAVP